MWDDVEMVLALCGTTFGAHQEGVLEEPLRLCTPVAKYSAFRFKFSARKANFPHHASHKRPEYLPLGRKI